LDRLGTENHGTSAYVKPGEDIEEEVSAFYAQVSHPVLSGLALDFGTVSVQDAYPRSLPDLFKGSQVVQLGRYSGQGEATVTLAGTANGRELSFAQAVSFPAEAEENDFLPRLWATRKIGFLLDQIRLNGEDDELVDEIISLSRTHGIITPYTSFLVLEDEPPPRLSFGAGFEKDSGADAVAASETTRNLAGATSAPQTPVAGDGGGVRVVGPKTFYLRDGVWKDAATTGDEATQDFAFGSDPYFDLLVRVPALGPFFSIGKEVVVSHEGTTYRVTVGATQPGVLRSDFTGDGRVGFADLARFAQAFGRAEGEAGFSPDFDLDGDRRVGFGDYVVLASEFGQAQ
jgi:Ca-activated chloride channel family protein